MRLPRLELAGIEPESFTQLAGDVQIADVSEVFLPAPPACEVAREVIAAETPAMAARMTVHPGAFQVHAATQPLVRWAGGWLTSPEAQAVECMVKPSLAAAQFVPPALQLPDLYSLRNREKLRETHLAVAIDQDYPGAVELPRSAVAESAVEERNPRVLRFPKLSLEQTTGEKMASFQSAEPEASEPAPVELNSQPPIAASDPAHAPAQVPSNAPTYGMPQPGPVTAELICQRDHMHPVADLEWIQPLRPIRAPKFVVRPVFERVDEEKPVKQVLKNAGIRRSLLHQRSSSQRHQGQAQRPGLGGQGDRRQPAGGCGPLVRSEFGEDGAPIRVHQYIPQHGFPGFGLGIEFDLEFVG